MVCKLTTVEVTRHEIEVTVMITVALKHFFVSNTTNDDRQNYVAIKISRSGWDNHESDAYIGS